MMNGVELKTHKRQQKKSFKAWTLKTPQPNCWDLRSTKEKICLQNECEITIRVRRGVKLGVSGGVRKNSKQKENYTNQQWQTK